MKKNIAFLLLFSSLYGFSQDINDKIRLFEKSLNHWDTTQTKKYSLEERMKFYKVNGISIAVIKDYKVEWIKAYGYADVSEKRPVTPATLFQAASISKTINSLGILKLAEEGKLNLEGDINMHLKTWQFPYDSVSKGKKISIANLLSHTGGLSTSGFGGYEKGTLLPTTLDILDGRKPANSGAVRSVAEPGSPFRYSGGGTTITQLILENTTGEAYETYMKSNILNPLQMNSSSYQQPPGKETENVLATGNYPNGGEVKGKYHIYPEKAAAGLWTNPTDLAKYIIETQLSLSGQSNKILSKEMSVKRIENNLGVFLQNFKGVKYFGHNGKNEGFTCAYISSYEGGNGLVVMTNDDSGKMLNEVICSIASLNHWENYPLELEKKSIALAIRKKSLKDADKGIALYRSLKKSHPNEYSFKNENDLNELGYELLKEAKVASAIKIFDLNAAEFPNSSNVYDSRGEAYFNNKEYLLSKRDYLKSLELDPTNSNATLMLKKIEGLLKK